LETALWDDRAGFCDCRPIRGDRRIAGGLALKKNRAC